MLLPAARPAVAQVGAVAAGSDSGGSADRRPAAEGSGDAPYFPADRLNAGLPPLDPPPDLGTPQASLENFVLSCEAGHYDRAARSLDLSALPIGRRAELAPEYARKLKAVMNQKVWIDWTDIPDRPDGQLDDRLPDGPAAGQGEGPPPGGIEAIKLGSVALGERDAEFWLVRLKPADAAPAWVISRQTVARVPALYELYGPSRLERRLPGWARSRPFFGVELWQWAGVVLLLGVGALAGWGVQAILAAILRRSPEGWARGCAETVRIPVAVAVGLVAFYLTAGDLLRLAGPVMLVVEPVVLALIVLSVTWLIQRVIGCITDRINRHYGGREDDAASATVITRVTVARHTLTVLIVTLGLIFALSRFEWFRSIGQALMASAGIAAIVLGIAAQRSLGNLFAGIQMALVQPVRVGDAVLFEGEFGWIERVEITYVAIRTWDLRRLVLPTAYFMDKPIQNWSMNGPNMMKPVTIHADYRVDVDAVRGELERTLKGSDDYDEVVPPILQVTGCTETTVELRALCSAPDPSAAWNLHCLVRERLVAFLRDHEGGRDLPRTRIQMLDVDGDDRDGQADESEDDGQQGSGRHRSRRRRGRRGRRRRSDHRRRQRDQDRRDAPAHASVPGDQDTVGEADEGEEG